MRVYGNAHRTDTGFTTKTIQLTGTHFCTFPQLAFGHPIVREYHEHEQHCVPRSTKLSARNACWRSLNRGHDHGWFSHSTTAGKGSARTIKSTQNTTDPLERSIRVIELTKTRIMPDWQEQPHSATTYSQFFLPNVHALNTPKTNQERAET